MRIYAEHYIDEERLNVARGLMAKGLSLQQAAAVVQVFKSTLDRALWSNIGGVSETRAWLEMF